VAADASGNVYVTGVSGNGTDWDYRTICYDSDGSIGWNKVYDSGNNDYGFGVAVDPSYYVYVTGYSNNGTDNDYRTICYDSDGSLQWNKVYDSGDNDVGYGVAVDRFFVYVTGYSNNGTDNDYRTIRYDKEGNVGWNKVYDSGDVDYALGVAVDPSYYIYVTGYSNNGTDNDFRTIKYEQDDIPAVEEIPTVSSLTLEIVGNLSATPALNYSLPAGMQGRLTFYSVDGRAVETFALNSSQSTFTWNANKVSAGVYFARLVAGNESVTVKAILAK